MREEHERRSDDPKATGGGSSRRSNSSDPHQPNGFTAVNDDSYVNGSFRPDESAKQYMSSHGDSKDRPPGMAAEPSDFHSHGWRPSERPVDDEGSLKQPREVAEPRKRKRSAGSVSVDDAESRGNGETESEARASAKRRQTATTTDSTIDLTSPVTSTHPAAIPAERRQHGPPPVGPYARERSPVARWNRGEPPPKPRPEIEASLAASVNEFHQTQQRRETPQTSPPNGAEQTSPASAEDQQQEANASDDDEPQGDSTTGKKQRKRNFSNRTKSGCHTCRGRKKKCDERKPTCGNCERGHFACQGYGPKPPSGQRVVPMRHVNVNVQPKGYEGSQPPGMYYQNSTDEAGRSYSHWGRVPTSEHPLTEHNHTLPSYESNENRYATRDAWYPDRPGWSGSHGPPSNPRDHAPPPDYRPGQYHRDLPPPPSTMHPPQQPPVPPIQDPFAQYGPGELHNPRPSTNPNNKPPPTIASSHSSSGPPSHTGSIPHHHHALPAAHHHLLASSPFQPSEKDNMLRGKPFLHWRDTFLIAERESCAIALDRWNKAARGDKGLTREAQASLFAQILDPGKRMYGAASSQRTTQPGPIGSVKSESIVEAPFRCDYGYNVHIGAQAVLQSGVYLQDAADVSIGDRVIIGPDVRIHTLTASVDPGARRGSQGHAVAGAVSVEDDAFVGAGAVVLPYCTVGRGAVVGAGSVVTRDVKEYTVVAGNPAKFIRSIVPSASHAGGLGSSAGLGVDVGEGQLDRRHAYEIQERNERVRKRMVEYATAGFVRYSPRLI